MPRRCPAAAPPLPRRCPAAALPAEPWPPTPRQLRPQTGSLPGGPAPQVTIRRLGAPLVATFLAMRLVAAVAASGPLLQEHIGGVWEVSGVAIVVATLTWYLIVQRNVGP